MKKDKFDFDELKKYYPSPSEIDDLSDYDVIVFKNNISAGKFIKSDKLTREEKRLLCEKLNNEWVETVVEPYCKSLCDFCNKYEIAMMKSDISLEATSLRAVMMREMLGNKLGNLFGFEE